MLKGKLFAIRVKKDCEDVENDDDD